MALALAMSARLKPEIRLAQAVSEFEADLTMEQKLRFNSCRAQVHKTPPEIHDVMQLTAEIDQKISPKVGRGRCYGPRLTNFLQGVQQFVGLGDILVGGSQNLVACGVWSLVRMSLMSLVNSASYLEKVSQLLMIVGRGAPRYQSMAAIYPRSKELQSNLCEYFIVVVRLCHHILKYTQKSTVMQFTTTLNTSNLDSFQPELEIWATAIKEEVNILMAKRSEDEATKNSKFRDWSLSFRTLESHQKQLAVTRRVLDLCSRYDYQVKWKQARKIGNSTVFHSDDMYQSWKKLQTSATLIYTGRLGSGKSVLMANIVDDLNLNVEDKTAVAYFFCRHDEAESLKAQTIIGSLARQLLVAFKPSALDPKRFDETELKDIDSLIELLHTALPLMHRAIFVLDGLDECDHPVAKKVIGYLRRMQSTLNLHICISLRLDANRLLRYAREQLVQCTKTSIPVDNPDIESFIERELENRIQSDELVIGDPELILDVRDSLMVGSQGMFLWVALQIDILCTMKTDLGIRQALDNLPRDLSNTFTRILKKHEQKIKPEQRTVLEILTVAQRPLTSEELREVLSVTPGDTTWDPGKLLNDVKSVLTYCGSLVTIDEEDSTVQFIHHSVKQFLIEDYRDSRGAELDIDDANMRMARLILTYLSYDQFDRQLSTSVVPRLNVTPYDIVKSTVDSHNSVQSAALRLLRLKTRSSKTRQTQDIGRTIQAMNAQHHVPRDYTFQFLSYAKLYSIYHLCATSASKIPELCLLGKILDRRVLSVNDALPYTEPPSADQEPPSADQETRLWSETKTPRNSLEFPLESPILTSSNQRSGRGGALFFCACSLNNSALLRRLIQVDRVDPNQQNEQEQTPFAYAAMNGYGDAVKELLRTISVNLQSSDESGCTPLMWAARRGFASIVHDLVAPNLEFHYSEDNENWLQLAREAHGMPRDSHERVDLNSVDLHGRTALSFAAHDGKYECVRKLLEYGADRTLTDDMDRIPLMHAAMSYSAQTVQQFYDIPDPYYASDFPDSEDVEGRTAISYAAEGGTFEIVRIFLLDLRIDPDSRDHKERSPLSYAAQYGILDIVDAFLADDRVDPDSRCSHGRSPLSWALERNKPAVEIVQAFVRTGRVDINSEDNHGQTPLIRAVIRQHYSIVPVLLDYGCNITIKDNEGWTALDHAVENGNEDIIRILRDHRPGSAGKKVYTS
ncbi:hypothetical protein EYB25_002525 [Talaromyces marneffei]|nr:hypothetical protein EYB25_002525 [Talaromyces marneffei]